MVIGLAFDAVRYKTENFDHPVSLIADTELAAAISEGYRQAGIRMPDFKQEQAPAKCRDRFLEDVRALKINENLRKTVDSYRTQSEAWSDDAWQVLNSRQGSDGNA